MRVQFVITPVTIDNNEDVIVDELDEREIDLFLNKLKEVINDNYPLAYVDVKEVDTFTIEVSDYKKIT